MRDQNTSCFEIDEFGCVSYLHKQRGFLPRCNYVERLRRSQGLSPRPHGLTAGEGPRGQSQRMTPSRSTSVSFIGHHASNMRVTGSGFFFGGGRCTSAAEMRVPLSIGRAAARITLYIASPQFSPSPVFLPVIGSTSRRCQIQRSSPGNSPRC